MGTHSGLCFRKKINKYYFFINSLTEINIDRIKLGDNEMNSIQYPYRDALRRAQDIYLDVMCDFIYKCLNHNRVEGNSAESIIRRHFENDPNCNILDSLDFDSIPFLFRTYWENSFRIHFDQIDRYYEARSAVQLIVEGRNRTSHPPWDIDPDYARTHITIIAEMLGKVNQVDKQNEVKVIRDELFYDDSKDRLEDAESRIRELELENDEYNDKNKELSQQIIDNAVKIDEKSKQLRESLKKNNVYNEELDKLKEELDEAQTSIVGFQKQIETTNKELIESNSELSATKDNLSKVSIELTTLQNEKEKTDKHITNIEKQLNDIKSEKVDLESHLSTTRNLLNMLSIDSQTLEHIYPYLDTASKVRIFDRRNKNGRYRSSYLTNLLELGQPTIIYVESEEKADAFFTHIAGERVDSIGRHDVSTSEIEEIELLEKLSNNELIAIVSSASFLMITEQHIIEHFVFCHPILDLEKFCQQCQPAFNQDQNAYLHLIYDTKQEFESYKKEIIQKYPDRATLETIYDFVKEHEKTNGKPVNLKQLCQGLDIKEIVIETGIAIFDELQFIEKHDQEVKLLKSNKKQLEDSKIYSEGIKLKDKTNPDSYQIGKDSIKNIYEKISNNLSNEQDQLIDEEEHNYTETKNGNQNETTAKTTEESEKATMFNIPSHSKPIVSEEQVNVIKLRSAAGEPLSMLSKEFGISSTAILSIVNLNSGTDVE